MIPTQGERERCDNCTTPFEKWDFLPQTVQFEKKALKESFKM